MSTVQLVHRVIQKARASGQAMTITDHMYDADIHQEGRGTYNDVHKALREGLMPGRQFAQWAGTVFLPDAKNKKRPEAWAKNRGFQVVDSIRPEAAPFFERDFRDEVRAFIEESDAVDVTSPCKLPPDMLHAIGSIIKAEYPPPNLAAAIIELLRASTNNNRTLQATLGATERAMGTTERAMEMVKTLKSDFKRLTDESGSGAKKSDDPDTSDESVAETAGGRVKDAMDAGSPVH